MNREYAIIELFLTVEAACLAVAQDQRPIARLGSEPA